jgi:hypothetical protein
MELYKSNSKIWKDKNLIIPLKFRKTGMKSIRQKRNLRMKRKTGMRNKNS